MHQIVFGVLVNLLGKTPWSRKEGQSRRFLTQCDPTCVGGGCCVSAPSLATTSKTNVKPFSHPKFMNLFYATLTLWHACHPYLWHTLTLSSFYSWGHETVFRFASCTWIQTINSFRKSSINLLFLSWWKWQYQMNKKSQACGSDFEDNTINIYWGQK